MKVYGIGAHRTGLTSLEYILRAANLSVLPDQYGIDRLPDYWNNDNVAALAMTDIYDGYVGPPWNMGQFYRVLAKRDPDAKFVLTVRPAREWVQSLRRYATQENANLNRLVAHGAKYFGREYHSSGLDAKASELMAVYRTRNNAIERFFAGTDRLFLLDWRTFRWGPFCDFLEVPHFDHDTLCPRMRRWEVVDGKNIYMANPPRGYRKNDGQRPVIHFTVSMWNRASHLEKLCRNVQLIANVDKRVALHVSFFNSDDINVDDARRMVESLDLPSRLVHLHKPFNNGRGHNIAIQDCGADPDDIVVPITVDLKMPLDICERIRANVAQGNCFYGPMVNNDDEHGKRHKCAYAYSLVAMTAHDYAEMGGFAENTKWGGDNDEKPEGGEDVVMCRRLRQMGLEEARPFERDLVCRWHPRDITSTFYGSLKRYKHKPWWTLTDNQGKPASFPTQD
jgi:hypothetical protein